MTTPKPEKAWCVTFPDGGLAVESTFKSLSISEKYFARFMSMTWEELGKRGYRCIPVMITPVEEEE